MRRLTQTRMSLHLLRNLWLKFLKKCKDLRPFTIPCIIGNNTFDNASYASFRNVYHCYAFIYFHFLVSWILKIIGVEIQLANTCTVHSARLMNNVLMKVDDLICRYLHTEHGRRKFTHWCSHYHLRQAIIENSPNQD